MFTLFATFRLDSVQDGHYCYWPSRIHFLFASEIFFVFSFHETSLSVPLHNNVNYLSFEVAKYIYSGCLLLCQVFLLCANSFSVCKYILFSQRL